MRRQGIARRDTPVSDELEQLPWAESIPEGWTLARLKATVRSCQNGLWGDEPDGNDDLVCVRVAGFDRTRRRVILDEPTLRSVPSSKLGGRLLTRGDLLI